MTDLLGGSRSVPRDVARTAIAPGIPAASREWAAAIADAVETADPVLSNFKITRLHHLLAEALRDAIGPEAGANFHSWAVWGSRKAGVTIRQEDKDQASRDATVVAAVTGSFVGVLTGWRFAVLTSLPVVWSIAAWALVGAITGGYCGYLLAGYTRRKASRIILEGNRIVIADIGNVTARYLDYVHAIRAAHASPEAAEDLFVAFLATLRPGKTERDGQDLLRKAFENYEAARRSSDPKVRHEANYFANCLAVLHEHIRLQPFISQSLPFLISKCVTQRLMTYSVGEELLAVHEDVPPLPEGAFPPTLEAIASEDLQEFLDGPNGWNANSRSLANTRASDWTRIHERMGYIVNLFRSRHLQADVVASPYQREQLEAIAAGRLPVKPW